MNCVLWRRERSAAYFGSKATTDLCQVPIALVPPRGVYIESHFGGGAPVERKPRAMRSIGVDLDGQPFVLSSRRVARLCPMQLSFSSAVSGLEQ